MGKSKGYMFAGISIFFWASTAALTTILLEGLDSIQIACISALFASLTLFVINVCTKKISIVWQYGITDYIRFFVVGFVGVFAYSFLLFTALFYLPAQEAFIINYLWPIMIIIFAAILLKEKLTGKKVVAIVMSFVGIVIVVTRGNITKLDLSGPLGIVLAVLAAVSYGWFSVIVKKYEYDKTVSMMFYCISGFIASFVTMCIVSYVPTLNMAQILGLGWIGILTMGIAFTTWALALKYGDTHKIANLAFITPFLSLVYIYFLLGEEISIYSVVGLVVIVLGIIIQNRDTKNTDTNQLP